MFKIHLRRATLIEFIQMKGSQKVTTTSVKILDVNIASSRYHAYCLTSSSLFAKGFSLPKLEGLEEVVFFSSSFAFIVSSFPFLNGFLNFSFKVDANFEAFPGVFEVEDCALAFGGAAFAVVFEVEDCALAFGGAAFAVVFEVEDCALAFAGTASVKLE